MTSPLQRLAPALLVLAGLPAGAIIVLLADRTNPFVPLALAAAVIAIVVAARWPLLTLLAAIALVPLDSFTVPLGASSASPAELMFVLSAFCGTAGRLIDSRKVWPRESPLAKPLLLLVAAVLPGLVVAQEVFPVVRLGVFWGAFLLLFALIATEGDASFVRRFLLVLAVVGGIMGVTAVLGSGGQAPELSALGDTATGRAGGAFGDPNILGTFLALAFPGAVYLVVQGRWRSPIAIGSGALVLLGLGLTLSRGAILAAIGAMGVLLFWEPVRRIAATGLALILVLFLVGFNPLGGSREATTIVQRLGSVKVSSSAGTGDQRTTIYRATPRMIADHWAFGVGAVNYPLVAPQYGIVDPSTGDSYAHAHNLVLTITAELGLPGFIALVWLGFAIVGLVRPLAGPAAGRSRGLALAIFASLAALALEGLVDFTFRSNVIAGLAFVLLGCLAVLERERRDGSSHALLEG